MKSILVPIAFLITALFFGFLYVVCADWTYYSKDYDEARFATIVPGMKEAEVVRLVGQPLDKHAWSDGDVLWAYSSRPLETMDYYRRCVFFHDGIATRVDNFFWDE